jgi:hypothetical protein
MGLIEISMLLKKQNDDDIKESILNGQSSLGMAQSKALQRRIRTIQEIG